MAQESNVNVPGSGDTPIATYEVNFAGVTSDVQAVAVIDPDTENPVVVDSTGSITIKRKVRNNIKTYSATVTAGTTIPSLVVATTTTQRDVIIQNFSENGTNSTVYFGDGNITNSQGLAVLDGGTKEYTEYTERAAKFIENNNLSEYFKPSDIIDTIGFFL